MKELCLLILFVLVGLLIWCFSKKKKRSIEGLRILGELSLLKDEYAVCNQRCVDGDRRQRLGVNNFRCIHECDVKFGAAVAESNPVNGEKLSAMESIKQEYVSNIDKCALRCDKDQLCRSECYRELSCDDLCKQECLFAKNFDDCMIGCNRSCTGPGYTI